jgi:hypothetical protein
MVTFVFFFMLPLLATFLHSYDKDYIKYIMAIQCLTKKILPIVEYKDNLHVFSSSPHSILFMSHSTSLFTLYPLRNIVCYLFVMLDSH